MGIIKFGHDPASRLASAAKWFKFLLFKGPTKIEQTSTQLYLGFVLSSSGDNMAHINMIKKKSIGVIKKIFNRLNSLNLQKYYFECSLIFLNVMLRPSILYGCDMMFNLKESEIRQIERIEENYMRKVLDTTRGCPIVQMYLELGHCPARIEIHAIHPSGEWWVHTQQSL